MDMSYQAVIVRAQAITSEQIATAYREISHRCDGPVTKFVLIARATRYVAQFPELERAAAEALAQALEQIHGIEI